MDMNTPGHNHAQMEREDEIKEMKIKLVVGGVLSFSYF